jgi:Biotin-lipoyl like
MMVGFLVLAIACFVFWLVFLKLKLLRPTPGWVFGFSIVVIHLMLIFVIGLRFVTPQSANVTIVQHTIQLIPRLSEPTLVTAVLVEENTEVKKGQPLFQFDRTIYEARSYSCRRSSPQPNGTWRFSGPTSGPRRARWRKRRRNSTTPSTRSRFTNGSHAKTRRA